MSTDHDVVIIGSGAAGGMAAYTLTKLGVKCLMLEAGPLLDLTRHRVMRNVADLPYRGFGKPGRFPHVVQASEFDANLWADEKQNPYTYDKDKRYHWVRMRLLGGKTLRWGRASWRLSDLEFKCKDHDGVGDNWPVSYSDLAPYYDRVEPIFRVTGRNEGLPQLPDGKLLIDDSNDSTSVQRFIESAKKLGVPTTKPRRAVGTFASSANLLLPDAIATGNLRVVPNAVVREISVDKNTGLVNGVYFLNRQSKQEFFVTARALVLGASTLESTRLLLNSKSRQYPNGLANSSGVLGKYLFDQFYVKGVVTAVVPEARGGRPPRNLMGGGGYVVRFRNVNSREKNFVRGYTYDFSSGGTPNPKYIPLYGEALMKELSALGNASFGMTTMGEVLPRAENHVRINPSIKDAWGIPALHVTHTYGPNEYAMAKDSMEVGVQICRGAGFEILAQHAQMVPPGESIHELGTCRMGSDAKTSVLNNFNQAHDVKNLFVTDGSSFVSGGAQNPTLTILALSMRAAEHLAELMKKRTI
jgi:choline dehydrogenase-like flavoprotein